MPIFSRDSEDPLFCDSFFFLQSPKANKAEHVGAIINSRDLAYLLVGRHGFAPAGLSCVAAQGLVVVPSAGLFAEAPRLPV